MKSVAIVAAIAGLAAAVPQGVSSQLAPSASAPSGCSSDAAGYFMLTVQTVSSGTSKRDASAGSQPLNVTLSKGTLTDSQGRIGAVVANQQFQFDGPPSQTGTIYNTGFSLCSNGSLALGNSAVWYQCLSGGFYNLYDKNIGNQCNAVLLNKVSSTGEIPAMTLSDGQVTAVPATMNVICQIGDGQIQKNTCITSMVPATVISQLTDGQPFVPTSVASSATNPAVVASSASTPAVQVASQSAGNASVTISTPTSPSNTGAVSTGAASSLNTPAFALVAGLLALFAL